MPWEEEQERLTQEARLNAASPAEVFRELKRTAPKALIERLSRDKALEVGLVERNDPLINLGLASYGTNEETGQLKRPQQEHPSSPASHGSEEDVKPSNQLVLGHHRSPFDESRLATIQDDSSTPAQHDRRLGP
jgi:hypothetical protein